MPVSAPPFDPPYISMHTSDERIEYIETLADGSTRAASAAAYGPALLAAREETAAKPSGSSSSASSKVYLKVPFAEKDEAKALGARWDAAKKKWYAPPGTDATLFERWMP